jgi:hypothetical protein
MEELGPHRTIFMTYVSSVFFENIKRLMNILHEELSKIVTMSGRILVRMRNVSNKSGRENQNTFYF